MNANIKNQLSSNTKPVTLLSVGQIEAAVIGYDIAVFAVMPNVFDVLYEDYLDINH